jgi:formylglycine-generating enzyme required for sulfatase activity
MKKLLILISVFTALLGCKGKGAEVSSSAGYVTAPYWEQMKTSAAKIGLTIQEKQQVKSLASTYKSGYGDIYINTIPPAANVIIDGIKVGKSPVILHKVQAGRHFIKIMLDTYKSVTKVLEIKKSKKIKLNLELQKYLTDIKINSSKKGAKVYIDGKYFGITPLSLNDVTMGNHVVWLQYVENGIKYCGYEEIWVNAENKAWNIKLREYKIPENFVKIPEGYFTMGIATNYPDERPKRKVYTSAFYISKYEVTNEEFLRLFPSHKTSLYSNGPKHPATNVTWYEAYIYAKKNGFRLPSEAEWEKAARGGKSRRLAIRGGFSAYSPGRTVILGLETLEVGSSPVGSSRTNDYGLYDMSGNANEWVNDWYGEDYFKWGTDTNPRGPEFGIKKAMKGSSWFDKAFLANLSTRYKYLPDERKQFAGFRCALNAWIND